MPKVISKSQKIKVTGSNINETKPLPIKEVSGDVIIGYTPCAKCGDKSTIMSNKGHVFCCLACQTAFGE